MIEEILDSQNEESRKAIKINYRLLASFVLVLASFFLLVIIPSFVLFSDWKYTFFSVTLVLGGIVFLSKKQTS